MYISYSGFSMYEKCDLAYWHRYVAKTVPPIPDNRVNMLYGAIVGKAFEQFYNEKLWRLADFRDEMLRRVPRIAETIISEETGPGKNGVLDWADKKANYKSLAEIIEDVNGAIPRGLGSIKYHKLVGRDCGAEVKLDSKVGDHILGGRCDFAVRRVPPHNDLVIIDGKGSKWRGEYVDKRQLRWYAMLYQEKFKILPDKTGFIYWRSEPEASLDWVDVVTEDTAVLKSTVLQAMETIEERKRSLPVAPKPTMEQVMGVFPARPSQDCRWCDHLSVCETGTRFMKNRGKAPEPISTESSDGSGVDDVGL